MHHYGALDAQFRDPRTARIVILSAGYERTVSYGKGTARGPAAILEASAYLELYDEELDFEVFRQGIHTAPDLAEIGSLDPPRMVEAVRESVGKYVDAGKFVVLLGGEHAVSVGEIAAYQERFPRFSVLQLDAHTDLRDTYEGNPLSHACVMRRVVEGGGGIVAVGIRSMSREERIFIREHEIPVFFAHEIMDPALRASSSPPWMEAAIEHLDEDVFVTIDIDVFDPSEVPATGTPEPGGLHWYDVTRFLELLTRRRRVIGFDLTELAPRPESPHADFLCAKLIYKLLGYVFRPGQP
ncbi:MAG: agmatinase [Deltaproteobacteria bacterium]|nr:MAG: agmatinase [Deltaproteobacteria bacterium]